MYLNFFIYLFPSLGFLMYYASEVYLFIRQARKDKGFNDIVSDAEIDMEEYIHEIEKPTTVAFIDNKAYWVSNNRLYQADVVDQKIDKETSTPVDVFSLSASELGKMLFVVDGINEED